VRENNIGRGKGNSPKGRRGHTHPSPKKKRGHGEKRAQALGGEEKSLSAARGHKKGRPIGENQQGGREKGALSRKNGNHPREESCLESVGERGGGSTKKERRKRSRSEGRYRSKKKRGRGDADPMIGEKSIPILSRRRSLRVRN